MFIEILGMTTPQEINQTLYRPLLSGTKYDSLIKKSNCDPVNLGKGNTKVTLNEMQKWTYKHAHEAKGIAKEIQKNSKSLKQLVDNVHFFVFNHFQYAIDESDQLLRSPSCAWQNERQSGIDCKSYSIIASSILLCLGVRHFFRRIQQSELPGVYTHVYIVVPKDQKTKRLKSTARFNQDYYIIDGTIAHNNEVASIKKDDLLMIAEPKLNIVGLASPHVGCKCGGQCHSCSSNNHLPHAAMGISFDDFSNLFGDGWSFNCFGGSYDTSDLEAFVDLTSRGFLLNVAIYNEFLERYLTSGYPGQILNVQIGIYRLMSSAHALYDKAYQTSGHSWSSNCSARATQGFLDVATFYKNVIDEAFVPYVQKYFEFDSQNFRLSNDAYVFPSRENDKGMDQNQFTRDFDSVRFVNLRLKEGVSQVPKFVINTYAIDNIGSSGFNVNSFLNLLTDTVVNTFFEGEDPGNNNQNNNQNGNNNNGINDNIEAIPSTSAASSSGLAIGIAVLAIGGFVVSKMKKSS